MLVNMQKRQVFKKIELFNNRFSYSVPQGMIETEPLFRWDDDFRYVKHHFSDDSSIRIDVYVRYAQYIQIQADQEQEAKILLNVKDAINERIVSSALKLINGKKVIVITSEYEKRHGKFDKGHAMRIVFNTPAGQTSVTVYHNYTNITDKEKGKKLFNEIMQKLEMH